MIIKAPPWFDRYVTVAAADHSIPVNDCSIHYRKWQKDSDSDKPTLLFVHGNGANLHWWDFIAPAFLENCNVVAIDLSGSGDSEHRNEYSLEVFAQEIIGVCEDANLRNITVVGHSFGGNVARSCAFLNPGFFSQLIMVDSSFEPRRDRAVTLREKKPIGRYYASLAEAKKRFKLRPSQPCLNRYILDYIAGHSLIKTVSGYYFKLDQQIFKKMKQSGLPDALSMIKDISCPVGLIYGEKSRLFTSHSIQILERVIPSSHILSIRNAHHHLFLEYPEKFIESLGKLTVLMSPTDPPIDSP